MEEAKPVVLTKPVRGREMLSKKGPLDKVAPIGAIEPHKIDKKRVETYYEGYVDGQLFLVPDSNLEAMKDMINFKMRPKTSIRYKHQTSYDIQYYDQFTEKLNELLSKIDDFQESGDFETANNGQSNDESIEEDKEMGSEEDINKKIGDDKSIGKESIRSKIEKVKSEIVEELENEYVEEKDSLTSSDTSVNVQEPKRASEPSRESEPMRESEPKRGSEPSRGLELIGESEFKRGSGSLRKSDSKRESGSQRKLDVKELEPLAEKESEIGLECEKEAEPEIEMHPEVEPKNKTEKEPEIKHEHEKHIEPENESEHEIEVKPERGEDFQSEEYTKMNDPEYELEPRSQIKPEYKMEPEGQKMDLESLVVEEAATGTASDELRFRFLISGHFKDGTKPVYIVQDYDGKNNIFKDQKIDFTSTQENSNANVFISGKLYSENILVGSEGKPLVLNTRPQKIVINEEKCKIFDNSFVHTFEKENHCILLKGKFIKGQNDQITPSLSFCVKEKTAYQPKNNNDHNSKKIENSLRPQKD